jgi:hypothetical protein
LVSAAKVFEARRSGKRSANFVGFDSQLRVWV